MDSEVRHAVSRDDIIAGLIEIVADITGVEPSAVTTDKSLAEDLDLDSLSIVEMVVAAEDRFGARIPDGVMHELRTLADAADLIIGVHTAAGVDATASRSGQL